MSSSGEAHAQEPMQWGTALLGANGYHSPNVISYGPLPQKIAIYDHVIDAKAVGYWNGPLALDTNTLEYVRGGERFRNPSNFGLVALPMGLPKWRNRVLHRGPDCDQGADLTDQQKRALSLIVAKAESLPNGGKTWRYSFALNFENMIFQPGFNSAFAQAVNIAALLFVECKTKDPAYLDLANKATLGLITPIAEGGLLNDEDKMTFFEELPAPKGLSPHILNADILSVNVLFAMAERTGDERFNAFAERGAKTLLVLAPRYDATDCIKYALKQARSCAPEYVAYEAVLFKDLAQCTGDQRFERLSVEWASRAAAH